MLLRALLLGTLWLIQMECIVIDPSKSVETIKKYFQCSPIQWIGSYNEFYQRCAFVNSSDSVIFSNYTFDAAFIFSSEDRILEMTVERASYHIELDFRLNGSLSTFQLVNSTIIASAIYVYCLNATVDNESNINTTAQGLKFGPGFNSALPVGSGYGGMGGSALGNDVLSPSKCSEVDVEGALYVQPIGDLKGSIGDFRGYGSGGGSDTTRGAGLVSLNATNSIYVDGRILANGGFDTNSRSRSGSGGTIIVISKILHGKGLIEACGGNATYLTGRSGGGGGGGGGRIVLDYTTAKHSLRIKVYGGILNSTSSEYWCQEGGAGTLLEITRTTENVEGSIFITGHRKDIPHGLFAGTPLFYMSSRREVFIEPWMRRIYVSGHALILASYIELDMKDTPSPSSITLESGCFWGPLVYNKTIEIIAGLISIEGYMGPIQVDDDKLSVIVRSHALAIHHGAEIIVNALNIQTESMVANGTILINRVLDIDAIGDIEILGHMEIQPSTHHRNFARIHSNGSITLQFDPSSRILIPLEVRSEKRFWMNISSLFHSIDAESSDIFIHGARIPIPIIGNNDDLCHMWMTQDLACTTTEHLPYAMALYASNSVTISQNILASSMLVCSPTVVIEGNIGADGLGCIDGGPGQSDVIDGASGGAGHGGKGGAVMPMKQGAGASYDVNMWPQWSGSSAASTGSFIGGKGGGLVVMFTPKMNISHGTITVRGGNGTQGGGGGSGGTIILGGVIQFVGAGTLDLSGGSGSAPDIHAKVWTSSSSIGGGGGGGILWIHYGSKGSGKDFHGHVILEGGKSPGQTGFDGFSKGDACDMGCGGLLCLPCMPGTFSPRYNADCEPCPIGTFSDTSGSTSCNKCKKGSFNPNPGSQSCVPCAAGQYAPGDGSSACIQCPSGMYSDTKGLVHCKICPKGTIAPTIGSLSCKDCDIGETTEHDGSIVCKKCDVKPDHATYNKKGKCDYACEKGRIGLDCLTPFEKFIQPIGGPLGFVLLCFLMVLCVFGIYGYLSYKGQPTQPKMKQYYAVPSPTPHSNSTHLPRLIDQHVTFHVARIYFNGLNTFLQPWSLSTHLHVDNSIKKIIYEGSFAGFATKFNQICIHHATTWRYRAFLYRICQIVLPPISLWILIIYQRVTVRLLFRYIQEYGTEFFRDLDLRTTGANVIMGYSSDYSLGYIDLLLSPDAQVHQGQNSKASLLFVLSGTGSFMWPYYLDTNDALVRAVPYRVEILRDSVWLEFVARLNQHLRLLTSNGIVDPILEHIETFNGNDLLNGYKIEFGISHFNTSDISFESIDSNIILPIDSKWAIYLSHPESTQNYKPSTPISCDGDIPSIHSIRYDALYAPDIESIEPLLPEYHNKPKKLNQDKKSIDSFIFTSWKHVGISTSQYIWLLPYALLFLFSIDFFTMLWILMEYFCIQVLDPMAHSTGCTQVAFELLLLCMPGAIIGTPLLGIVFVLKRNSRMGRMFVLWNHVCWINISGALACNIIYHAYLGEYVLALVLGVMAIKLAETKAALYVIAKFENDRQGRGWRGLFTTQEYYDAAYRRF